MFATFSSRISAWISLAMPIAINRGWFKVWKTLDKDFKLLWMTSYFFPKYFCSLRSLILITILSFFLLAFSPEKIRFLYKYLHNTTYDFFIFIIPGCLIQRTFKVRGFQACSIHRYRTYSWKIHCALVFNHLSFSY